MTGQGVHFIEGGCVLALEMNVRDFAYARVKRRVKSLDQRRFADSGHSRKERDITSACIPKGINSLSRQSGNLHHRIAGTFIDLMEGFEHFRMGFTIEIDFVKDYCDRDVVDFAGDKDTVQERQLDLGIVDGRDDECAVEIGCDDM